MIDNETTAFLKFFEICMKMHFVSLFLLNERNINITTSLLTLHLKRTVEHYANISSISLSKPPLNYRP